MKLFALTLASFSLLASAPVLADPTRLREDVRAVAPALEKYALGTLLGDVWKRPGLSLRDRSIITLAALITRNQTAEMADYLNLALDNGVKPAEVSETITHLAFYSGWGNAMSAVAVAKDVFAARKVTPPHNATSHSSLSRACKARCTATSEVEQAVCTAILGPRKFSL